MYLHKMYNHQKFKSVVSLYQTNLYLQRKNAVMEQADAIKDERKRMQLNLVRQKRSESASAKKASVKNVPRVVQSAKFLMAEKKEAEKELKAAEKKK